MDQSDMPACDKCGEDERRRTRNTDQDGTRRVLCDRCLGQLMRDRRRRDIAGAD